jgi:hypothetical protein
MKEKKKHHKVVKLNNELNRAMIKYGNERTNQCLQMKNRVEKEMRKRQLFHSRSILEAETKDRHEKIK